MDRCDALNLDKMWQDRPRLFPACLHPRGHSMVSSCPVAAFFAVQMLSRAMEAALCSTCHRYLTALVHILGQGMSAVMAMTLPTMSDQT